MVKVASATLLIAAALVAGPVSVFASGSGWEEFELESRSLSAADAASLSIFARETDELFARIAEELELDLEARGFEDGGDVQELAERSKIGHFFHKLWHGIKKVASVVMRREDGEDELLLARSAAEELDELFERTIEDIDARSPGFANFMKNGMTHAKHEAHAHPHAAHHAFHAASALADAQNNDRREYDELDLGLVERDEFDFEEELYGREYEEDLYGREFEEFDLDEREFDELDELD